MTLEALLGCQAGSAATAQEEAAGAQPELRGTGRRGPGTADPGERPCHGEAGGWACWAALEHGRFPAGPHRQPLSPAHARLPRARYRVSRGETGAEDANSRGLAPLEPTGLLGAFGPYLLCPQRWEPCLSPGAAPGTTGAPESGGRFLGPTDPPPQHTHRVRNWAQGYNKVFSPLWSPLWRLSLWATLSVHPAFPASVGPCPGRTPLVPLSPASHLHPAASLGP